MESTTVESNEGAGLLPSYPEGDEQTETAWTTYFELIRIYYLKVILFTCFQLFVIYNIEWQNSDVASILVYTSYKL